MIIPRAPPTTPWHSEVNNLWIPPEVASQLHVTKEAKAKYVDPQFLPQAKKARVSGGSANEVLRLRLAARDEPLPTLCSSYSSQHMLDPVHLANKGIFAVLDACGDEVSFLSPLIPLFCRVQFLRRSMDLAMLSLSHMPSSLGLLLCVLCPHSLRHLSSSFEKPGSRESRPLMQLCRRRANGCGSRS